MCRFVIEFILKISFNCIPHLLFPFFFFRLFRAFLRRRLESEDAEDELLDPESDADDELEELSDDDLDDAEEDADDEDDDEEDGLGDLLRLFFFDDLLWW